MSYTRQKPRRLKASRPVPAVVLDHSLAGKIRIYRRKHRGQAAIIIALCSILLIAVVGLAVDGGSAYTERRKAQNAADAAAMGGTTLMLKQYEAALMDPANNGNLPGTAAQEDAIYAKIQDFVRTNGAITSTIETYFVDRNKGIVTVPIGEDRGQGHCGASRPCQVSENGQVPWTRGAIGITVKARSQTGSFFMGVLGWDNASAAARATAFMGVSATTGDISVIPIALFREPREFENIRFGETYTLLDGDITQGS